MKTEEEIREYNRKYMRKWSKTPKGRAVEKRRYHKDYMKRYRARRTPEKIEEYNRRRRESSYSKEYGLKTRYGITLAQRDEMITRQGGVCAVCERVPDRSRKWWAVDHCHSTGRIRGILCGNCNIGLGLVNDDPKILRRMIDYLAAVTP